MTYSHPSTAGNAVAYPATTTGQATDNTGPIARPKRPRRWIELGLLLAVTAILALAVIAVEIAANHPLTTDVAYLLGGFIIIFTVAHLVILWKAPYSDQIMLPVAALLNAIGLVMIYRLDLATGNNLVRSQIMWTVIGVAMMVAVIVGLRDHRSLQDYSFLLGIAGLIFMAVPMVWPTSLNADANVWVQIGPFSIQPGEFSKILLLLFFASLLTTKRALFNVAGTKFLGMRFPRLRDLGPILVVWGIALVIMAGENDFGPALLLFGTVLGMLYIATSRPSWIIIGLGLAAIGAVGIYNISAKIQTRVDNFIDPISHYNEGGYQLSQALFGLSWGGITGTGLGRGYPEEVPVAHSDFILAAIGEELGLVGLSALIILYAVFVTRGMKTALKTRDTYGKLVASGLSLTIAIQVFVVVGGISRLLPMTGLTTPFVAHGGSSLLANYMLLAIILRISNSARQPASVSGSAATPNRKTNQQTSTNQKEAQQ